jgi:hypothetical protein
MGRHSLVEAPKHLHDESLADAPTQFIPVGHDGASAPTEIIPVINHDKVTTDDILYQHVSPSVRAGLGRRAVVLNMNHAETGESAHDFNRRSILRMTRKRLDEMTKEERLAASQLLDTPPRWLEDAVHFKQNKHVADVSFLDKLVAKTTDGEPAVGDDTLQSFLDWHNHSLVKKQEIIDDREEELKALYIAKFHQAQKAGWILPETLHHLDRLKFTRVVVDDGFDTALEGAYAHAQSTRKDRWHAATISPLRINYLEEDLMHEFTHILDGRDPGTSEVRDLLSHGMSRIFGEGIGGVALNEALTEQFSDGLLTGNIDQTDPDSEVRRGNSHVYYHERQLLHALCAQGVEKVDIRTFLDAFFEDTVTTERLGVNSSAQQLTEALMTAFPFTDVIAEIRELSKDDSLEEYTESLARRSKEYIARHPRRLKLMSIIRPKSNERRLARRS